jgi:hypothetical protein
MRRCAPRYAVSPRAADLAGTPSSTAVARAAAAFSALCLPGTSIVSASAARAGGAARPADPVSRPGELTRSRCHGQPRSHAEPGHAGQPVVRVFGLAVGAHPHRERGRGRRERGGAGVVAARDEQPARADLAREGREGRLDLGQVLVVVQVLGLDAGDHRGARRQHQERAVALVSLGHEQLAGAIAGPQAGLGEYPADDVGGVRAAVAQHSGQHRGRRGLAVRACDRDALLAEHDRGQHRRAGHDPDPAPPGLHELGVVGPDG